MTINIPVSDKKRVVIVGSGFAGLTLARKLAKTNYQIVLIDKNNFHQFQPLFYQVAMSGLEPSSIAFPLRKLFQKNKNVHVRMTEVKSVEPEKNTLYTTLGDLEYDYLVLAMGADTNFFGNEKIASKAIPMKSVSESLYLRNRILNDYEKALSTEDYDDRQGLLDIVIVGGGPTGVEVAGSLAEMKKFILPKDYPEIDIEEIDIHLVEGLDRVLPAMSEQASAKAQEFLEKLGVEVKLNALVTEYDGKVVRMNDGTELRSNKMIWAAGVKGSIIEGLPEDAIAKGSRIKVNRYNQVEGYDNIFAIGDVAYMEEEAFPKGQPQVAQVAIQHGRHLFKNLKRLNRNQPMEQFSYNDKGSMATVGRNKAVVDLPFWRFQGAFAWLVWMFVHLFSLVGVRNKLIVFINWVWNYFTYDQALRLIIRPRVPKAEIKDAPAVEEVIQQS